MRIEFAFAGDDLFAKRDRRRPHGLDLTGELVLLLGRQIQGSGVFQNVQGTGIAIEFGGKRPWQCLGRPAAPRYRRRTAL
jgi:hypothetical protein